MEKILQILLVVILSATKFLTAPITSLNIGFGYLETLLITTIGGVIGVVFFYYLSAGIMFIFGKIASLFIKKGTKPKPAKKFTWKNKLIVRVKRDYGLIGLAAITPTFLSIPLGTFLASRYFHDQKKVITYLCASVIVWSVIVSSVVIIF